MKNKLLRKLKRDIERTSIYAVAKAIDMEYSTLYRIISGEFGGRMSTWEKIADFYDKHKKVITPKRHNKSTSKCI